MYGVVGKIHLPLKTVVEHKLLGRGVIVKSPRTGMPVARFTRGAMSILRVADPRLCRLVEK